MEITLDNFSFLFFWKRNQNSIEDIDKITITKTKDKKLELEISSLDKVEKREFSSEEFYSLVDKLNHDCEIEETPDIFQAYLYENVPVNTEIKFFFCIEFTDYSYIAIKGLLPFKQPHYHDILNTFMPLIKK